MRRIVPTLAALAVALTAVTAGTAQARPPLRDVPEIDDGLMAVAIADQIRKNCDDISARMIRAYSRLSSLKSKAQSMGYTDDEIEDYVTSKDEKRRMRSKAESYLARRGVDLSDDAELCRFGKSEIRADTAIGSLLR